MMHRHLQHPIRFGCPTPIDLLCSLQPVFPSTALKQMHIVVFIDFAQFLEPEIFGHGHVLGEALKEATAQDIPQQVSHWSSHRGGQVLCVGPSVDASKASKAKSKATVLHLR